MKTLKLSQRSSLLHVETLILVLSCILSTQAQSLSYSLDYNANIFFHWKGALTSHSLTLKIFPNVTQLNSTVYNTYLALYTKSDNNAITVTSLNLITFTKAQYSVAEIVLGSLNHNTKYFYSFIFVKDSSFTNSQFQTIYSAGVPTEFSFRTLGMALTPYSFTFGAASCASTGSESAIFNTLAQQDFDFFVHMGDLHYSDIAENNITKIYDAYFKVFSSSTQKTFFQSTPIFYVWDDHDFGAGNAIGASPSNPAVNLAYRNFVPHGTLKNVVPADDSSVFPDSAPKSEDGQVYQGSSDSQGGTGVFQSFIIGRCLFIIMDLRSYKDVVNDDVLGVEQTSWLENQLKYAGYNDNIVQVFLVSSFPWIHEGKPTEWSPYTKIQANIAQLIKKYLESSPTGLIMLSGDAHMIAFDDGSNNPYGNFPVVQAAALDRWGSCKGGPYSHGFEVGPDHYGKINVIDNGADNVCIKINLKNKDQEIIQYDTCNKNKYSSNISYYCPLTSSTTVVADDEGGFSLTVIICVVIILIGLISWYVYDRSRKQQQRIEAPTPEANHYVELEETPNRRRNNM